MPKQLFCVADTMDGAIEVFQGGGLFRAILTGWDSEDQGTRPSIIKSMHIQVPAFLYDRSIICVNCRDQDAKV